MAEDEKGRKEIKNPKGRPPNENKASEEALKGIQASGDAAANEAKVQSQLNEVANKLAEQGLSADDKSFQEQNQALKAIQNSLKTNPGNAAVIEESLEKLKTLEEAADKNLEAQKESIENDSVVRSLEDLVEENKRTTKLLTADSTAQLELRKQIKDLNNGFYSGEFFNDPEADARAQGLKDAYDKASADLQDAIEAGNTQAQDLAMRQLEQIKESAESEENQREARKMNQLANDRLYRIADAAEKTADGIGDAISGALATAGVLAGLAGLALLFINPEAFQAIVESIIDQVSGVVEFIEGIITGDFEMAFRGLGDSWMLLTGVFLALLPKIISIVSRVVKAVKVFRVFMLGSFIPGMISMFTGMISAMTPILAALSPILTPIAIIAAILGGIYLGLEAFRKAFGFTSIFDMLMMGVSYLKDAFAHVVNAVGSIVNFILGMVEGIAGIFGFEIDLPTIPKMATDNAEKKKAELKAKEVAAEEEKLKEQQAEGSVIPGAELTPDLEGTAQPGPTINADEIAAMSADNEIEKSVPKAANAIVTNVTRQGNQTTSSTSVTTIQAPLTRASNILSSVTAR
jgi:hypothetical protein